MRCAWLVDCLLVCWVGFSIDVTVRVSVVVLVRILYE